VKTSPSLGIALGGGGARGAAHIGVLQEMSLAGIEFDIISGVSSGSVIAAMYAYSKDPLWIEKKMRKLWDNEKYNNSVNFFFNNNSESLFAKLKIKIIEYAVALLSLHKDSIISKRQLKNSLKTLVPFNDFNDLKIPLKVVVTDLENGKDIVYESGDIIDALVQSCSIPGVIAPTYIGKKIITDGGVGMPIPIPILKKECDFIIAVDIGLYQYKELDSLNAKSITKRANIITSNRLKGLLSQQADYVIRPDTLGKNWSEFKYCDELFNQGKIAVKKNIDELKKKIHEKKQRLLVS